MKEANAASTVPITITGSYNRPVLALTFNGMVYENTPVQGNLQGNYTSGAGMYAPLRLTGTGYDRTFETFLQER